MQQPQQPTNSSTSQQKRQISTNFTKPLLDIVESPFSPKSARNLYLGPVRTSVGTKSRHSRSLRLSRLPLSLLPSPPSLLRPISLPPHPQHLARHRLCATHGMRHALQDVGMAVLTESQQLKPKKFLQPKKWRFFAESSKLKECSLARS